MLFAQLALWALFAWVLWYDLTDLHGLDIAARRAGASGGTEGPPPPIEPDTRVDVVIPIYNMGDTLAATLDSVARSAWPARRVIVVDDGSDDGETWPAVQRLAPRIDVVERIAHGGKAAAANRGAELGDGEVVLWLDADSTVAPDFIERTLAEFRADPQVGAIDFVQRVSNPRASFWTRQAAFERALLGLRPDNFGALFAMRREHVEAFPFVDCLSPQFEINTRLRAAGVLRISPAPLVFSEEPVDLGLTWRRKRRWTYGFLETLARHGRRPDFHILIPVLDLLLVALVPVGVLAGAPALALPGLLLYLLWTAKALWFAHRLGLPFADAFGHGLYMLVVNAAVVAGLLAFWRRRRVVWR